MADIEHGGGRFSRGRRPETDCVEGAISAYGTRFTYIYSPNSPSPEPPRIYDAEIIEPHQAQPAELTGLFAKLWEARAREAAAITDRFGQPSTSP